jgi:WD40 repeat protein
MKVVASSLLCGLLVLTPFGATPGQEKKAEPKPPLLVIDDEGEGGTWDTFDAALSPDGKRLVTGHGAGYSKYGPICVWDTAANKQLLRIYEAHKGDCNAVAFSPDGKRIVSGGGDLVSKVWDAQTGKLLLTLKHDSESVTFSPDGKRIITADWYTVKVWDAETGKEVFKLKAKPPYEKGVNGLRGIAVSPDGKRIARCGYDNKIEIWDAETGKEVLTFPAKVGMHIAFSPDSKRIVSAYSGYFLQIRTGRADDGTFVTVWDAATGKELLALERPKGESFGCAAFSPDGKWIVAGGFDRTEKNSLVKVWDAATGKEVATFSPKKRATGVVAVSFTPDGKRIVAASGLWTVHVWAFDKP